MQANATILADVTGAIERIGNLTGLSPQQDFYDAGFTSVLALPLLLELEDKFGLTIPDDAFINARTAADVADMIVKLQGQ